MLKILNRTLVGFRGFSCAERAEVTPTPGLGIFFARVQPVLPGFQFPNHTTIQPALQTSQLSQGKPLRHQKATIRKGIANGFIFFNSTLAATHRKYSNHCIWHSL
jgi:hypothetical protein